MSSSNWQNLMVSWNEALLADPEIDDYVEPEFIERGWLGFTGATETQIMQTEQRLGRSLPPSYREFLKFSNGWRVLNFTIERLWSTDEVDWFAKKNQRTIDEWLQNSHILVPDSEYFIYDNHQNETAVRVEYLQSCLHISATGDAADLLLNPQVVTDEGEWEAWFFASWLPGARRYQSFWDLMQDAYRRYVERGGW